jgi:hypothetical protein
MKIFDEIETLVSKLAAPNSESEIEGVVDELSRAL